jgi:hypothetical protein
METRDSVSASSSDPDRDDIHRDELPTGVDRRTFLMRSAVVGAAAVLTGREVSAEEQKAKASAEAKAKASGKLATDLSPALDVVKKSKGPVMTTLEEFYKVGPGPSSSHTIGPMRITYDFYQRCTKLPKDTLAKATAMKVHLFGSLSATGKGHGTERAALAGIVGKEPATVEPEFLDGLAANPKQTFPVQLGAKTLNVSLEDVVYDAPNGQFPHPNTMTCKLMGGSAVLHELEYYSVGGGFIEWKGYQPPKKGQPKVSRTPRWRAEGPRREEQALDRAGRDGERDRGLGQEPGRDRGIRRQDHHCDGQHREGGIEGAHGARCRDRSSSRRRPARSTSARWTTSTRSSAASAWSPRMRSRAPRRTRAVTSS